MDQSSDLAQIRDLLLRSFNDEELRDLYFEFGLEYADLAGETRPAKAREFLLYCRRSGCLGLLIDRCRVLRPQLSWPDPPSEFPIEGEGNTQAPISSGVFTPRRDQYYYCYISQTKVEQIIAQNGLDQAAVADAARAFHHGSGPLATEVNDLLTGRPEFGKPTSLRLASEAGSSLVTRLEAAMYCLEQSLAKLPRLNAAVESGATPPTGAYLYEGVFTVSTYDERFAYMESTLPLGMKLKLSCSIRYFSDFLSLEGGFQPHSGNVLFFSGELSPAFHTLLYILQVKGKTILGTPLFLALPLNTKLVL